MKNVPKNFRVHEYTNINYQGNRTIFYKSGVKNLKKKMKMRLAQSSAQFSLPSYPCAQRGSGAICSPRSVPKHRGTQRCYFSKLALSTSCRGCVAVVQGKVGNFWGPVPLVAPSLSPASPGAALWGCHNSGLYNMGYFWRWLVTVDEVLKAASLLMVSVKILESGAVAWLRSTFRSRPCILICEE